MLIEPSIFDWCYCEFAVGSFCDAFGPRLGHAFLLSCSSTAGEPDDARSLISALVWSRPDRRACFAQFPDPQP